MRDAQSGAAAGRGSPGGQAVIIAHRGASGYRPEHTAAAYRLALDLGADAVEPDVVATRDGVLVVRHENEISGTTDVADHPELADRRTTKEVDGRLVEGWFTEDMTWAELSSLRARERLPGLRPGSARYDGTAPLLRLADVVRLVLDHARAVPDGRPAGLVVELKHATHFAALGLRLDELLERELDVAGSPGGTDRLTVESFEKSVLVDVAARGTRCRRAYLARRYGAAYDLVARHGTAAEPYAAELSPTGLERLAGATVPDARGTRRLLHAISVEKDLLLHDLADGSRLVADAHGVGLGVLCFTLRPENRFLHDRYRWGAQTGRGYWAEEFAAVLGTGVDGVFVDHPELARLVRDAGRPYDIMGAAPRRQVLRHV